MTVKISRGKPDSIKLLKIALFVLGAGLLLFGVFSGDCRRLFMKAVFVCMECAGIG